MFQFIAYVIRLYEIVLLIKVVSSWIQADPHHPFMRWINQLTDPVLEPVRKILPANRMGLDFSPLIVFLILELLLRMFAF
ncbi:MAG: YggT family protein [Chitinivibrionales bacterium]|nr:YggT family protein [Chitinivibrionales bacterium]